MTYTFKSQWATNHMCIKFHTLLPRCETKKLSHTQLKKTNCCQVKGKWYFSLFIPLKKCEKNKKLKKKCKNPRARGA